MNTVGNSANVINLQPGWQRLDWIVLIGLIVVSILAFLAGLGSFGILDPSDGYYSEGAREMFLAHNWLTPHLNYVWFFDKPIMNYWLISASYAIFGVTEFASRLPAAICGAALVPVLYAFMRQFCRSRDQRQINLFPLPQSHKNTQGFQNRQTSNHGCVVFLSVSVHWWFKPWG